jgi:hypothetical protein
MTKTSAQLCVGGLPAWRHLDLPNKRLQRTVRCAARR